MSGWP